MAGESARALARRQREKADRLQRSAELWERGADGERATALALDALPSDAWKVFHDVRWPGRRYANVDHVVVGPGGVFVVDSKNWSGTIAVRDNVLRQNGRAREQAVVGAAEAALAVMTLTPSVVPQHVQPVLCFVRDELLSGWARDVMVCSTANLVQMLSSRPEVLPQHIVREASLQLDAMSRSATAPNPAPPRPATRPAPRRVAASVGAHVASRPARHAASPSRRRKSRKSGPGPVKAIAALVFLAVLVAVPQVITSLAQGVAGLLTTQLVEDRQPLPQAPEQPGKKPDKAGPNKKVG